MAVVLGTNCGFVTEAPVADPEGGISSIDNYAQAIKDTTPVGAAKIIEIGWYCNNSTEESNFEVGIYTHNVGDNNPEAVVGSLSQTNAKGTGIGWKVVTGLNIPINPSTIYWIGLQLDNTATATEISRESSGSGKYDYKTSQTTLSCPWGTSSGTGTTLRALYAVVESAPTDINPKVKVSGTFATKKTLVKIGGTFAEKPVKVKVGGVFQ